MPWEREKEPNLSRAGELCGSLDGEECRHSFLEECAGQELTWWRARHYFLHDCLEHKAFSPSTCSLPHLELPPRFSLAPGEDLCV